MTTPARQPQRIAAAWVLGALFVAMLVVAWLRGAGRLVVPLVLAVLVATVVVRIVRAVLRPLP